MGCWAHVPKDLRFSICPDINCCCRGSRGLVWIDSAGIEVAVRAGGRLVACEERRVVLLVGVVWEKDRERRERRRGKWLRAKKL